MYLSTVLWKMHVASWILNLGTRLMSVNFTNRKKLSIHWTGGWMDVRASTDMEAKRRVPISGEDQNLVIQLTGRCTPEWAIPANKFTILFGDKITISWYSFKLCINFKKSYCMSLIIIWCQDIGDATDKEMTPVSCYRGCTLLSISLLRIKSLSHIVVLRSQQ